MVMMIDFEIVTLALLSLLWFIVIYQSWTMGKKLGTPKIWLILVTAFILIFVRVLLFAVTNQFGEFDWTNALNWFVNLAVPLCFIAVFYKLNKTISKFADVAKGPKLTSKT